MRKLLVLLLVVVLVAGCGPAPVPTATFVPPAPVGTTAPAPALPTATPVPPTPTKPAPTNTPAPQLKVGLVTDVGKVNDGTFNELSYKAMLKAADDFKLKSAYIETLAPTDYAKNITQFAEEKYDIIIASGFMLGDAINAAAKKYPSVKFAIVDSTVEVTNTNSIGLLFAEDQAAYLAGALAGQMTKSKVVGFVGGMEIPPVIKYRKGYEAGVKSVCADCKVLGVYIDSFTDPARGKEAALSQIAEKADVIFGAGGPTGSGGIKAAAEKGVWVIGVDQDEYFTTFAGKKPGYDKLLSSALKRVDTAVYTAVGNVAKGTWKGGNVVFDATNDGVGYADFHEAGASIPKAVQDKMAEILKGMKAGTITTGVKL